MTPAQPLQKERSESGPPRHPHKLRILVLEDHADTAYGLKMYFTNKGHDVHVALDVKTARQLASSNDFDILLCDLALPDGNGWDFLRELRTRQPVRAIAMSGHNEPEDIARSAEAGFFIHLGKPVAMAEVDRVFGETMKAAPK